MNNIWIEMLIVLLMILANGLFALSEIALVTAKRTRLYKAAQDGDSGAARALELMKKPGRFLSTVQIGITLIGIFSGAFGGARIAVHLVPVLAGFEPLAPYAEGLSLGIVVVGITYLSLVLGELVPKRVGMNRPETIAGRVAPLMNFISRLAAPFVSLLSYSTNTVVRLLGVKPSFEPAVTEEDVRMMIDQGAETGIFDPIEEEMVEHVFRLADRRVEAIITPRTELVWLDLSETESEIIYKVKACGHSHYPVAEKHLDHVLGIVSARDLLVQLLDEGSLKLRDVLRPALFVPEGLPALRMLEQFRQSQAETALVLDEYGGIQGMVTLFDILEAIVGDLPEEGRQQIPGVVQVTESTWLLEGMLPVDEFKEILSVRKLPKQSESNYQTVSGFVMAYLDRIPEIGDEFNWGAYRFEVREMEGRKVDQILVTRTHREKHRKDMSGQH
ncbi:MAG: HlyC/CorC family transporter [Anaerolineales bacterium]|nr:HlyC/CorC family transporter [Anaerolineales bacterium]